ncbi:copper ion binding [Striga asiatica]|uniref:Copper ion binding n=1 Tax=Striga asiatica TaxID=4170 RepID=A0A5A7Q935_STRAF|nr:copper ion binding [Striga asiatica]
MAVVLFQNSCTLALCKWQISYSHLYAIQHINYMKCIQTTNFLFLSGNCVTMASRIAARYISRRFSSGGKVLSEEEKAAENVYIKGPKADEASATSAGGSGSVTDAKPSAGQSSSAPNVSTDKDKNYAVAAGIFTIAAAFGWYWASRKKQPEEVQD